MITTRRIRLFLIALLTTSGILHFLRPAPFVSIVPRRLPHKAGLVAISGAAELACAGLLAVPAGRRFGGPASAALFAAVFPANVTMALRAGSRPLWYRAALWARLPLQIPLVVWSLRVGMPRSSRSGSPATRRSSSWISLTLQNAGDPPAHVSSLQGTSAGPCPIVSYRLLDTIGCWPRRSPWSAPGGQGVCG